MKSFVGGLLIFSFAASVLAAEPEWQPVATELLKAEKTGFGGLSGIVVDHATGELWAFLSDRGAFHSADQGKTWKRVSDMQPKGRTETPGCWLFDPTGKTSDMATALVYGSPIAVTTDKAATWELLDGKSNHIDWCAVDWTDPERKFILALKHEAGGLLLASRDGGKSFAEVGKGYGPGWVFDNQTAVVARARSKDSKEKPALLRTTDGGKTFQPCGEYNPVGRESAQALPKWRAGFLYWLTDDGLIVSADKGQTWKNLGPVKDAQYGPVFGKDDKHLFVLTKAGVVESADRGATWSAPVAAPKDMKGLIGLGWLDYDPKGDALYLMKMGSDLYRLPRR